MLAFFIPMDDRYTSERRKSSPANQDLIAKICKELSFDVPGR